MVSNISVNLQPTRPAPASPAASPFSLKRKTMSITQTYYLAHKARAKLSKQAARPDHDLRLLVGHANLLDSLMLELADAEREQESWFNQSVRGATVHHEERIDYDDTIIEEPEEWDSSDSSDEEDEEDEDVVMADTVSYRRIAPAPAPAPAPAMIPDQYEHAIEDDSDEDDEDFAQLSLVRSSSHPPTSPLPELDDDSESSEDEAMPPSPPTQTLTFSEKELKEAQETASFYSEGFYLPPRNPARIQSTAVPVY
jgi:hypothetical protein